MSGPPPRLPDLVIPDEVLRIVEELESAGFETWCVGGAIRDMLFGEPNLDVDLATAALPTDVMKLFRRTIPIGVDHGTVAVLDRTGKHHEVTTFRKDVRTDGRHAVVEFGVSLEDDLARRDYTMNAIAFHPPTQQWQDPFDGVADIGRRLLRAVGDPATRFREDYLRILRGLRLSARFGATIDDATWSAMRGEVDGIRHLSAERVREEWFKGIRSAMDRGRFIETWQAIGALERWLPEVTDWGDVGRLGPDPVLVTAAVATKPATVLERLKASRVDIERARAIASLRAEPMPAADAAAEVRRWLSRVEPRADDLLAFETSGDLAAAVSRVRDAGAPLHIADLAIDGHGVKAAGFSGRAVGQVLARLLEEVLEDPSKNRLDYLRERLETLKESSLD